MKVMHVSSAISWRGGEQQLVYLAESLHQKGIRNVVLCPAKSELSRYRFQGNIEILTYKKKSSIQLSNSLLIKNTCIKEKVDIIHIHDSHAHNYVWLSYVLFRNQIPSVLSRKVDFPVKSKIFSKYNHPYIKKILCVSDKIRSVLKPAIKDQSRLQVIYDGIDIQKFENLYSTFLADHYPESNGKILIGNISAIADHKDYKTFLNTAEALVKVMGNKLHFFVIGGDGGVERQIKEYTEQLNLESYVTFTGFVENAYRLLDELDILLFTSKTEGLGTGILDAFAAGCPVVCTNAGGIPEIAEHEINCLMSEVGDAEGLSKSVIRLIEDHDLRNKIIDNSLEKVNDFSIDKMLDDTINVYKEVLNINTNHNV